MGYRFVMHRFADAHELVGAGRPLSGRTAERALSEAASLWNDGIYDAARGYIVIDSDDGTELCRHARSERKEPAPLRLASA